MAVESLVNGTEAAPIFVYGTLLRGHSNFKLFNLGSLAEKILPAKLSGHKMYSLNDWYPCVVPSSNEEDCVYGEILYLHPETRGTTLMKLDMLENFVGDDNPRSSYIRKKAQVSILPEENGENGEDHNLQTTDVEYYRWNQSLTEYFTLIPSGDWKKRDEAGTTPD